jgi:hypothetical protein
MILAAWVTTPDAEPKVADCTEGAYSTEAHETVNTTEDAVTSEL